MKNAQDAKEKASSESHKGVEESTEMNNPSANTACEQETCNEGNTSVFTVKNEEVTCSYCICTTQAPG